MTGLVSAAPVFAALGDPVRLRLISELGSTGPLPLTRLAAGTTLTRQGVAKHLDVLAAAGLATSERRGRERIWRLHPDGLTAAAALLSDASARWDSALERLTVYVEQERPNAPPV